MSFSFTPAPGRTWMLATSGWSIGWPIWERSRTYISSIPSTFATQSWAIWVERRLYILPIWLIGFLPLVASMLIGRLGVISPLQRLPRPTEPSSPISADVPVTVKKTLFFLISSAVLTWTTTLRFVLFFATAVIFSLRMSIYSTYSRISLQWRSTIAQAIVRVMVSLSRSPMILMS